MGKYLYNIKLIAPPLREEDHKLESSTLIIN